MARTREFDPDEALDKAMRLFWRKGYAETSVRDLVDFTGVAHAGLYSAFGDKRSLYTRALEKYRSSVTCPLFEILEAPEAGLAEIEAFFAFVGTAVRDGRFANGCFLANAGVEFAETPGPERDAFLNLVKQMTRAFETALRRARERGEIGRDIDTKAVAAGFVATFNGLSVLARAGAPMVLIERAVAAALDQLR